MHLKTYDNIDSFRELEHEWNELLERSYANRIFSTFEWQLTWLEAYRPDEIWVITCRDQQGKLIGIAPWFIEIRPDERVVRSIGCVDVTDYVDLIVDREWIEPVLRLFAAQMIENHSRYDRVNLCNIPEGSPTLDHFAEHMGECGFTTELEFQEVCPVIELPDTWEGYLERLDKKNRHELRRKLRRAEGETQSLEWYIVGPEHDLQTELDAFLELMAASQPAKAAFLSDARNRAFFQSLTERTYARGWLQLDFLVADGVRVAAYYNFAYNGNIQVYNSGLLPSRYGQISPGIVLVAYNIRHAIEQGRHLFDFLRGNEEYKYRLGAKDTRIFKLKAQAAA